MFKRREEREMRINDDKGKTRKRRQQRNWWND